MPELPDIEVFTTSLNKLLKGEKIMRVKVVNGKKLPHTAAAYTKAIRGQTIQKVFRSGKEMRLQLKNGTLLGIHLMLTGDIFIFEKKNDHHSTLIELYFQNGTGLALTDRMKNAKLMIDPEDKGGMDALSEKLNLEYFRKALQRKKTIKALLTDQNIIRGIGNSYSDEILWQAGISPWSVAEAIPAASVKKLLAAIKSTLRKEIENISRKYKGKINGEVKEFLKIHTKNVSTSPTGAPIIITKKGMMKTYYTREQVLFK